MENNMENKELIMIPYVVHRDTVAHDRWIIKRLIWAVIVCVVLMFASNALWLYGWLQYDYSSEYEEVVTTVDSEGDGIANYTGRDGGVTNYGEGNGSQTDGDEDAD